MNKYEREAVIKAIKIVRCEWPRKNKCKETMFGCWECAAQRAIEDFESLVVDFMPGPLEAKELKKRRSL